MAKGKLTARQERFCKEFIIDLNATQAGLRSGYSKKSIRSVTSEILTNPDIQDRIRQLMQERMERLNIDADAVVAELSRIGFSDIGEFITITKDGTVIPKQIDELGTSRTRLIQEISCDAKNGMKLKLHDKLSALVNLGRHFGLFDERVTIVNKIETRPELKQFSKQELRNLRDIISKANKRRGK